MRADHSLHKTRTTGVVITVVVQSIGVESLGVIQDVVAARGGGFSIPGGGSSSRLADEGRRLLEECMRSLPAPAVHLRGGRTRIAFSSTPPPGTLSRRRHDSCRRRGLAQGRSHGPRRAAARPGRPPHAQQPQRRGSGRLIVSPGRKFCLKGKRPRQAWSASPERRARRSGSRCRGGSDRAGKRPKKVLRLTLRLACLSTGNPGDRHSGQP